MNKDGSVFIDLFLALVKIFDSTLSVGPEGEGSWGGGGAAIYGLYRYVPL